MIKEYNIVSRFNNEKSFYNNNILIIGTGKWSGVVISEILKNFINVKKIFVYGSKFDYLKKIFKKNKRIFYETNLNFTGFQGIKHCIICNKNADHIKTAYKLIKLGKNTLIEKPLIFKNLKEIQKLIKLALLKKKVIYLSLPFSYSFYIKKLIKKKIDINDIKEISLKWFDKYNLKKNYFSNKNINFQKDNFYHFFSFLRIFNLHRKLEILDDKSIQSRNIHKIILQSKKKKLIFLTNKKANKRTRILNILFKNNKRVSINFSRPHIPLIKLNNKNYFINDRYTDKMLKYQLFSFFNKSNSRLHEFKHLKELFKILTLLK